MSAVLDEPVKPRRPRPLYWLWLGCVTLFWCIAAVVTTLGLSMSMRGRLVGGTSINLFATAFLGTVMMMATGLLVATWKVRVVPGDLTTWSLITKAWPIDPLIAKVWWWIRLTAGAWFVMMGLILLLFLWFGLAPVGLRP